MKLRDVKNWIESLPEEFLEFEIMNGEYGELIKEDEITYRLDKPITRNRQESQRTSVVG